MISSSNCIDLILLPLIKTSIDYTWLGKLENEIRQSPFPLDHLEYTEGVDLYIYVPIEKEKEFIEWINGLTNGQAQIRIVDSQFLEFKLP